jgi:hypothetical protein
MRKKQREFKARQRALDLEIAQKVDEEREKIRRDAAAVAVEEQHLRPSEMEREFTSEQHGSRTSLRNELHKQCRVVKKAVTEDEPFEPFLMN